MSILFDRNYKDFKIIFFENFEIFSDSFSITISYPKILIVFAVVRVVSIHMDDVDKR